jgi:hypothetical protein
MPVVVHSSRFEHKAIGPRHAAQQFKISSAWALLAGSLALGGIGILLLKMDIGFLLKDMSDAWLGDHTRLDRYGLALFSLVFHAIFSLGGLVLLYGAITLLTEPCRLQLNGKGQLIVRCLLWRERIAIESIKSVELERLQDADLSWSTVISIKYEFGKLVLPLFKGYEKFAKELRAVCPEIEFINIIGQ